MFGGVGFDSAASDPLLNDLWEYQLSPSVPPVAAALTLTSSANPVFTQNPVTFTASVPNATGMVDFCDGETSLGSVAVDASGNATLPLPTLPVGTHTITANYTSAATNLSAIGSITEQVGDFSLTADAPTTATLSAGDTASFKLTMALLGPISVFPTDIALSASGGPVGARYVFSPTPVSPGSEDRSVFLLVMLPAPSNAASGDMRWPNAPTVPFGVAATLWPFIARSRRARRVDRARSGFLAALFLVAGLGSALALSGCGNSFYTGLGSPGGNAQTYSITIVGSSGALNHSATVTLVVN